MNINIGKSARTCAECGVDFVHEQGIHSLVHIVEDRFERTDFCGNCSNEKQAKGAYSFWNAQYYDPQVAEQAPAESFSPLRQAFYEAAEDSSRKSMAIAYLSGQLLRRQKVFRLIKETKDPDTDESLILFNDRIGNRLIEVNDPNLSHAELDEARKFLMGRLAELEMPEEEELSGESDTDDQTEAESTEATEATTDASTQETAQI